MVLMRALHKVVRSVYSASPPWGTQDTMHAVYAISHHQLCTQQEASRKLAHWLYTVSTRYTDTVIPPQYQPEGYTPTWCYGMHLLKVRTVN